MKKFYTNSVVNSESELSDSESKLSNNESDNENEIKVKEALQIAFINR